MRSTRGAPFDASHMLENEHPGLILKGSLREMGRGGRHIFFATPGEGCSSFMPLFYGLNPDDLDSFHFKHCIKRFPLGFTL